MLTASHHAYIARRIRCPQTRDDIAQQIAVELWRKGINAETDPALVTCIVKRRTINAIRGACRREDRARTWFDGSEAAAAAPTLDTLSADSIRENAEQLLALAGEYAADLRRWMNGDAEQTASFRGRVLRGLKRIRAAAGVSGVNQ